MPLTTVTSIPISKLKNKSESQKPIIEHELDDDAGNYDFDIEVIPDEP